MPINYDVLLNTEILLDLGKKLRQQRLNFNLSAKELSKQSGLSLRTLSAFERGETNISIVNLIELLRVLKLLNRLQQLIPELPLVSPLEIMQMEKKRKKRVRK